MNDNQRTRWLPLILLGSALLLWAAMLAIGAFLQLGADQPASDLRKPLAILGAMCVFLAAWGVALWLRGRRK
jgi:hypothetical protein